MRLWPAALAAAGALWAGSRLLDGGGAAAATPAAIDTAAPQTVAQLAAYGKELFDHTRSKLPHNVGAQLDCSACHIAAGTKTRGGSLVGTYAEFPQWNKRSHRVIAIQDRIAECFLYSENGRPPAYYSRDMEAMTAYIASLSKGIPVGTKVDPQRKIAQFKPPAAPNAQRGAAIYAAKCSMCHAADGSGHGGAFPPLWGPHSFNDGAGMHKIAMMAGFVRYNMPKNAPGTLTDQQAYDVAAYVLHHSRPHFDGQKAVTFSSEPASYF